MGRFCAYVFAYLLCVKLTVTSTDPNLKEGQEEKPLLQKTISLEHFIKSYNYVNKFDKSTKRLSNEIQGYITPWNSQGYDNAKLFSQKLSLASPVWFQLKPGSFEFGGRHDVDQNWVSAVRSANKIMKLVPRIIFENWEVIDYQNMLANNPKRTDCIKAIRNLVKEYGFDGVTLEVWVQHYGTSQMLLIDFINELAKGLHIDGKILVLPIPPNYQGRFGKEHFDLLVDKVDFFNLMAYDYSNPHSPGANAPLAWAAQCVKNLVPDSKDSAKRAKVLLGLNFYGYDYVPSNRDGRAVLAHDVIKVAKTSKPTFEWHEESAEHSLEYTDENGHKHSLYFPTTYSIAKRVTLAEELGVGLSIWDMGQGFNTFFDQL